MEEGTSPLGRGYLFTTLIQEDAQIFPSHPSAKGKTVLGRTLWAN
jgi:hypothetical protein